MMKNHEEWKAIVKIDSLANITWWTEERKSCKDSSWMAEDVRIAKKQRRDMMKNHEEWKAIVKIDSLANITWWTEERKSYNNISQIEEDILE
jgi:hypothetical protein